MNKVAIITGGTTGIGREITLMLAENNYNVVVNYRFDNGTVDEMKELLSKYNVEAMFVEGDVSNFEDCKRMCDSTVEKFGQIDVLINNAGITRDGLILRMSEEDFDSVISVNLKGAFNMIKNCTPYMMKKKSGRIVSLASVVGVVGNAGQANYAASKAGIIGLTKSAAKELASRNILVNAVAPGYIQTKMTEVLKDEVKEEIAKNIPLKRLGTAKDIANVVKFLVSEESSYVTGQVINIDGGMVM